MSGLATTSVSNNRLSVIRCKSINSVTATEIPVPMQVIYDFELLPSWLIIVEGCMLKQKIIKRIVKAIDIKGQPCPSYGTYLPACVLTLY